jgi:ankyrin repeat protein
MTRKWFRYFTYVFVIIWHSTASSNSYVDFFRAVGVDNADKVSELLAKGFDPNTRSESGQVGLYLAMREDSPKVAAVLLASPALNLDAANAAGETALMMAALKGRLDWARKMVERGAAVRRSGWTPLHYAATGPNVAVVEYLLDQGAEIDARASNGNTPLMMAARYGAEDSVRLLVQRGANKQLLNAANLSAADMATMAERPWLLRWLQ